MQTTTPCRALQRIGVSVIVISNLAALDATHNRIVQHCADRTGCAHFGLLVGQQDGLRSLGLVGLLVKYSPDVETALTSFVRHLGVHVRGAHATLTVEGKFDIATMELHTA